MAFIPPRRHVETVVSDTDAQKALAGDVDLGASPSATDFRRIEASRSAVKNI
jgi:hypothetical protein